MSKKSIAIIAGVVAVAIIIIAVSVAVLGGGGSESYAVLMERGNRYLEQGKYDDAILAFNAAIRLDENKAEAYMGLAEAYLGLNKPVMAATYLQKGADATGSFSLRHELENLIDREGLSLPGMDAPTVADQGGNLTMPTLSDYIGLTLDPIAPTGQTQGPNYASASLNGNLLDFFCTATYGDYNVRYGLSSGTTTGGVFEARFSGTDWSVVFADTATVRVIEPGTDRPYEQYRPAYITLADASVIFNGQTVTYDLIQTIPGIYSLKRAGNEISFNTHGVDIIISCDDNGTLIPGGPNRVMPPENTAAAVIVYTLYGTVYDAQTGRGVPNAAVTVTGGGFPSVTTATNANGDYSITLDGWGAYTVNVSAGEYYDGSYNVNISANNASNRENFYLTPVPPPTTEAPTETMPADYGLYTLSGIVMDATTTAPIGGVSIRGVSSMGEVRTTTSDSSGYYTLTFEDQTAITVSLTCSGYVDDTTTVYLDGPQTSKDLTMVPVSNGPSNDYVGDGGTIRIVLSWNTTPYDLDSYLQGTSSTGKYVDVNFTHRVERDANGATIADLDVDDTSSYGPETITLYDLNGSYRYFVNDFTSSGTMSADGATVKVYVRDSLVETIDICSGCVNDWYVLEINGDSVSVVNAPM